MGIKIGGGTISSIHYGQLQNDYSAMQGPCPNGFHIPDKDEWETLVDIGATIGAYVRGNSGTYATAEYPFRQYFKIPRIAYFDISGALNVPGRFAFVCYLSCKDRYVVHVIASGGRIPSPIYNGLETDGFPIRPFKDVPEVPDSNWTMVYDGSSTAVGAGIFYNSSLGLISASKDGVTWKTIADKDIGATNPYNQTDGSVQIDAVGHMFQWGNNYGHPYPDSVTTSSTQVDASSYGPGNYYNDSTWITTWPRDSSDNLNLWGGTTGAKQTPPEVKKIMMRPNNVETQIWPIGGGWAPGPHTLIYMPLNSTYEEANLGTLNRTFTAYGVTWGSNYMECSSYGTGVYSGNVASSDYTQRTASIWCYITDFAQTGHYGSQIFGINDYGATDDKNLDTQQNVVAISGGQQYTLNYMSNYANGWHNLIVTSSGAYIDNTPLSVAQVGSSTTIRPYNIFVAKNPRMGAGSSNHGIKGKLSEFIFEDRERSTSERAAYFNQTKGNYGIS